MLEEIGMKTVTLDENELAVIMDALHSTKKPYDVLIGMRHTDACEAVIHAKTRFAHDKDKYIECSCNVGRMEKSRDAAIKLLKDKGSVFEDKPNLVTSFNPEAYGNFFEMNRENRVRILKSMGLSDSLVLPFEQSDIVSEENLKKAMDYINSRSMMGWFCDKIVETRQNWLECSNCGIEQGKHRGIDLQCPANIDEHGWSHGWLETKFKRREY